MPALLISSQVWINSRQYCASNADIINFFSNKASPIPISRCSVVFGNFQGPLCIWKAGTKRSPYSSGISSNQDVCLRMFPLSRWGITYNPQGTISTFQASTKVAPFIWDLLDKEDVFDPRLTLSCIGITSEALLHLHICQGLNSSWQHYSSILNTKDAFLLKFVFEFLPISQDHEDLLTACPCWTKQFQSIVGNWSSQDQTLRIHPQRF